MTPRRAHLTVFCMLLFSMAVVAQTKPDGADAAGVTAADFAWMTGRWIGHLEGATAEQICSTPQSGEMLCLFRVFVQGRPVMFETYTLFDTAKGLELRSLHFSPDLIDKELQKPLIMRLQKCGEKEVVFAGEPTSEVATSSLLRDTPTTMTGVIMFRNQPHAQIRVRWEKVAYDALVNYNPSAKP